MPDYTSLGLDQFLNSQSSPAALPTGNILQPKLDSSIDWSSMSATQLRGNAVSSTVLTTSASLNQSFTTTSFVDVTNSSTTFILNRDSLVLFLMVNNSHLVESAGNTADGQVLMNIDGSTSTPCNTTFNNTLDATETRSAYAIVALSKGAHTVKLQARLSTIYAGAPSMTLVDFAWSYLLLTS